ncbi:uncharacterized protein JCM6883_003873 [Sporobolomyces salmoneus]|uniref:uncharacterized protein n=1 Tax=Sporobolomyces salmoneus TaxID=183962 RepID=UPI00318204B1
MPVPFIPIHIVSEVLSHFNLEDEAQITEAVGKSTSLVCRSWRPVGLRWSSLSIEPLSAPDLLDHLLLYPHLTNLVLKLDIRSPNLPRDDDSYDSDEADEEIDAYEPSIELLSMCPELKFVRFDFQSYPGLDEIIILCSKLQKLEDLHLLGTALRITPQVKTAFRKGFPVLKTLMLKPVQTPTMEDTLLHKQEEEEEEEEEEEDSAVVATSSKSQLRTVGLMTWLSGENEKVPIISNLLDVLDLLKSAFDWSRVGLCLIGGSFLEKEILLDVIRLPSLINLFLLPIQRDLGETFSTIVGVLPRMTALKSLHVEKSLEPANFVVSPVEIWEFLELIPSNLETPASPRLLSVPTSSTARSTLELRKKKHFEYLRRSRIVIALFVSANTRPIRGTSGAE